MKTLSRLFTAVFILFAATACGTKEIDHPDTPDNPQTPDTPQDSEFTITASIVKTRVIYSDDPKGGYLDQKWQVGDVLFGYYGGKVNNKIVFNVSCVSDENGVATLVVDDEYKEKLASLTEDVAVDLVYTGSDAEYDDEAGTIKTVTMTGQTGSGKIPACMHSKATVVKEDGIKKLDFKFINDCAIFEIESLTGISAESTLNSVTISSLYPSGKYSFDAENGFTFSGNGDIGDQQINLGTVDNKSWTVDSEGDIFFGAEKHPVLVAVAPIADDGDGEGEGEGEGKGIKVTADIQGVSPAPSFTYSKNTLQSGCCYVISKREVVARTIDGECHETVAAAFARAAEIAARQKISPTLYDGNNTVTLIKDKISSLGTHSSQNLTFDLNIVIGYSVVLDLNGCTLSLDGGYEADAFGIEYFTVSSSGHLTIKDSKSGGKLESDSNKHIIVNAGTVNIENGIISHNRDWSAVDNSNKLTIIDGSLSAVEWYAVQNSGEMTVSDGYITAYSYGAILNENATTLKIEGGEVSSVDGNAVENKNSALTVTGGTLTSTNSNAIYSEKGSVVIGTEGGVDDDITIKSESNVSSPHAAIYINDGTFTMYSGTVSGEGKWCALEINGINSSGYLTGSPSGEIFGGKLVSQQYHTLAVEYDGTCTVSGGELYCLGSTYSTINVKNGDLEINWPKGTVFPTGYDSTSGKFPEELPAEPLIFCCSTQFAPIEAPDIDMNNANQGEVKINGGYLFACNYSVASESSRDYYADDSRQTGTQYNPKYTDSVLKSCGHFFSTVYNLDYDINVPNSISQPNHWFVSDETSPVDELIDSSLLPTKAGQTVSYNWYYIY